MGAADKRCFTCWSPPAGVLYPLQEVHWRGFDSLSVLLRGGRLHPSRYPKQTLPPRPRCSPSSCWFNALCLSRRQKQEVLRAGHAAAPPSQKKRGVLMGRASLEAWGWREDQKNRIQGKQGWEVVC